MHETRIDCRLATRWPARLVSQEPSVKATQLVAVRRGKMSDKRRIRLRKWTSRNARALIGLASSPLQHAVHSWLKLDCRGRFLLGGCLEERFFLEAKQASNNNSGESLNLCV